MTRSPHVLFIHNNFPAQFGNLALWMTRKGWSAAFATAAEGAAAEGLRILPYKPHREPTAATHPYAQPMERAALYAQAFARAGLAARREGYRPDVIVAHSGWGAGMCARDVFPEAAYVAYCEWWYRHPGVDVAYLAQAGFPAASQAVEAPMFERMRNAPIALDIASADAVICPTAFQAAQFPASLRAAFVVDHDGVDVDAFRPDPAMRSSTLGGLVEPDARVVSYATRGMEPHRGFPQFMAALPAILAADPKAVAVVAGENRVVYGGDALRRTDWKAAALAEHDLPADRVRFVGALNGPDFRALLQRSDAHVYLTAPFVLSWSMIEAMSAGCALVLSDTAPVREFAGDDAARLVDLRAPREIAAAVLATLGDPSDNAARRHVARGVVLARLAQADRHQRKRALFERLIGRAGPAAIAATRRFGA